MLMFPVDVIYEIISRVPVKSLLRFRSVSKKFCALIDSSEFIKFHLNRSSKETNYSNSSIIFATAGPQIFLISMDSLNNAVELDHPYYKSKTYVKIIGSCCGLLALYRPYKENMVLLNPSTKKHKILPRLPTTTDQVAVEGFGYDAATGDYKLVIVLDDIENQYYEIYIYSLKTNSWKIVRDCRFPYGSFEYGESGVVACGALNWEAMLLESLTKFVIAFDLKNENFFAMQLPDQGKKKHFNLSVLGGSLAMTTIPDSLYTGGYDIWVMKEYGIKESWTKLFSFKPHGSASVVPRSIKPLVYSKCGKKILFHQNIFHYCWYDIEKKNAEKLQIHGLPRLLFGFDYIYTESLVSLDDGDKRKAVIGVEEQV